MSLSESLLFFINVFRKGKDSRSKLAINNILGSSVCKFVTILVNLILVPLSIDILNTELYGLWLTISSLVMWLSYFDIGFTQGFRNRFAEAKAIGNFSMCRTLLSTTYFLVGIIFLIVWLLSFLLVPIVDWSVFFNVKTSNDLLVSLMIVLCSFLCLKFVLNIINSLFAADQHNSWAAYTETAGLILTLLGLYMLKLEIFDKSIIPFAYIYCGVPCVVLIIVSLIMFTSKYKIFAPRMKYIKVSISKSIMGLGIKIFIIQISNVFLYQLTNFLILRYCGGNDVTHYNVTYRYFGVAYMMFSIVVTPFWTAFTDAQAKKDYRWIELIYSKLSMLSNIFVVLLLVMIIPANTIFRIWVPSISHISTCTIVLMAIYFVFMIKNILYINLLNGLNKVNIQMISNIILCICLIPILFYTASKYGTNAIQTVLIIICASQSLVCHIVFTNYLKKISTL